MEGSDHRSMAHALAMQSRGNAFPPDSAPTPAILDSWVRCMNAGLDATAPITVQVVEGSDLARRRERAQIVRRLAQAELETLAHQIAGSNFLLAFADRDGVILDLYADNRFSMSGSGASIVEGSCWNEELCGTNGLGTALATGASSAVSGMEHFFLSLGDISCTATPIRDAAGDVVGVLDASSYFESRQRHTQALVQMAAMQMENGLLLHQMRSRFVMAIHPRSEFLGTLSAGLLAFDEDGRLAALNARGRSLLAGLDAVPNCRFEDLFGEPFERVVARLQRRDEVQLRDVMGSALVASCRSRPLRPEPGALPIARPTVAVNQEAPTALATMNEEDPAVSEARRLVALAVRIKAPILISGETGSGKEVLARHAHEVSGRGGAFVAVNCGALPDELFESELFGYASGAFTGARREGHAGLIVSADGGTLLLDEIGELPLGLQAALLRFLDDRMVRPVGGAAARRVDVQLLAATNADLEAEVAAKRFRADLLYRLNTVCVSLPPLRQRRDFAFAVRALLSDIDTGASLSDEAVERLRAHPWPGNFRELRSVLTRALLEAGRDRHIDAAGVGAQLPAASAPAGSALQQVAADMVRREFERSGRSVSRTARSLGVSRTTVYRHLRTT